MSGVSEGQRDDVCTRLAGYYLTKMPPDIVREVLYTFADRCTPPLPHADVDKCVDSVLRKERTKKGEPNTGDKDIYHYCPPTEPVQSNHDKTVTENVTKPLSEKLRIGSLRLRVGFLTKRLLGELKSSPRY